MRSGTTKGESAYELRKAGKPWAEVAEECGCASTDSAVAGAKKWALRNDKPWPISIVTKREKREREREKRDARWYEEVASGTPIRSLGNPTSVYRAIDRHADQNGLPRLPKNGERAYNMRVSTDRSWSQIARALGYRYSNHATEAARRHAQKNGLEWPVPTDE